VVEIAERKGNLRVLRFLWDHRSCERNDAAERRPAGDCTVQFYDYDGEHWRDAVIEKAVKNGQLAQCLDDGMQIGHFDRVAAIEEALRLSDFALAERLVPPGRSIVHYAATCPQAEVIQRLLNEGFLHWDEERAAVAFRSLAERGSCELMQQILQLHSPLLEDQFRWRRTWWDALKTACAGGNTRVLKWLLEHPMSGELCNRWKEKIPNSKVATTLFNDAATKGHIEVMEYLYEKKMAALGSCTIRDVVQQGPLKSVKWLADYGMIDDKHTFDWAINDAALSGRLDVLQLFHSLDKPGGYEAAGLKRRRTGPSFSPRGGHRDTFHWAARGGHVAVLEWLQANYPAQCGPDAMDVAAFSGHLDAVKWLHANRTMGCTCNALHQAAANGQFEVVKWLYLNRPESRTYGAVLAAFRNGHVRIAYWLYAKYPDLAVSKYEKLLQSYCLSGKAMETLLFLRVIWPNIFSESAVQRTREECASDHFYLFTPALVRLWLDDNYRSTAAAEDS
jgi:hypothetical protein